MNGKFIVHLAGPISKYRLDIFNDASPSIKDYFIFFTNKDSYEFYKEYHDSFEFVFIDDLRSDDEISKTFEVFPDPLFKTEGEYYRNLHSFYKNQEHIRYWPHETRRFIFKYLLEHNILNFCIVGNNVIFKNDVNYINNFFAQINPGYLYAPFHGEDAYLSQRYNIWNSIQSNFPEIKLYSPFLRTCDGYLRGHHFKNKEDMLLYFNIWNDGINKVLESNFDIGHNNITIHLEWVSSHVMQFFEHNRNYKFVDYRELDKVDNRLVFNYVTRPEDKLFKESLVSGWDFYGFDYSDLSCAANFIKNNKSQLQHYYGKNWGVGPVEITDNHVFTRIN